MATVDTTYGTYLTNLFNPQVIGDMIDVKLFNAIKLAPLARVYNNLVGRPGNTVTLPYYTSIGTATVVAEGTDIPITKMVETTKTVTVIKVGKGVQITDEAVLSGYGDPIGEAISQIAMAIADQVDVKLLAALAGNVTNVFTSTSTTTISADDIADALTLFGEDIDGDKVLLCSAAAYANFRKADDWLPASEIAAETLIRGTVGMIHGCQVVVTNRIGAADPLEIVKPGALALYTKRDTLVETDRDIVNKSTVITADRHFAAYLLNPAKAIKVAYHA